MKRILILFGLLILVIIGITLANQFFLVEKAHSTFENYYAFRGCTKLLKKTDSYGLCKLANGQTIKLVQVNNKWYLDGDLPVCYFGKFCL